jgi:hypothetical protein
VTNERSELVAWVAANLDRITPGQFLLLEYLTGDDLPVEPYAQAALDPDGWCCELVSAHYLPGQLWSVHEMTLIRSGWHVPDASSHNYWQTEVAFDDAAQLLVEALWFGRNLTDPDCYAISIGTFPCGRRGGERLPGQSGTLVTA